MAAELVHGSGEIDGNCLIYRWLHDTTFPGEALSPYLILLWLPATGNVVVEDPRNNQTVWAVMPWPNPGDPVCQDLTQRLWTNQKMVKTPNVAIGRVFVLSVSMIHERRTAAVNGCMETGQGLSVSQSFFQ